MTWIRQNGQAVGWTCFLIAFLIVMLAPDQAWLAIPLYVAAGFLFVLNIVDRRKGRKDR